MIKVLCNKELQQWCFAEADSDNTDLVFMSKSGDMVKHTTVKVDIKTTLQKMDVEGWDILSR